MREPQPPAQQADALRTQQQAMHGTTVMAFDFGEARVGADVGARRWALRTRGDHRAATRKSR